MKKSIFSLFVVFFLLMFSFIRICFGWSGAPKDIRVLGLVSTHTELTRLSLLDIASEEEVKEIAAHSDDPDIYYHLPDIFLKLLGIPNFCHRVTNYEKDFRAIRNENMKFSSGAEWGTWYWTEMARQVYKKNPNNKEWMKYLGYATHFLADALCPPHCRPWLEMLLSGPHYKFEIDFTFLSRLQNYKDDIRGKSKVSFIDEKDIVKWVLDQAAEVYKMDQTYVQQGAEERGWYNTYTKKFTTAISYQEKGESKIIYYYDYDKLMFTFRKIFISAIYEAIAPIPFVSLEDIYKITFNKKLKENFMQGLSNGEDGKVLIENFRKDLMELMNIDIDYKILEQIFLDSLRDTSYPRDIYIFEEENLRKIFKRIGEGIRSLYSYIKSPAISEPTNPNILGK